MITYHDSLDDIPEGALIIGIEATIPAHRAACAINIDPQHEGGDVHTLVQKLAIIEADAGQEGALDAVMEAVFEAAAVADDEGRAVTALTLASAIEWERVGQVAGRPIAFLTSRPDLDALASMALADLDAVAEILPEGDGYHGHAETEISIAEDSSSRGCFDLWARVALVEAADAFSVGATPWKPVPLPTVENPWAGAVGGVDARRDLAAINAACLDLSVPLSDRVTTVRAWLLTGEEPTKYREQVEARRFDLIRQAVVDAPVPGVATVTVDLPGATGLGYCLAPRVVYEAPNFLGRLGFRKFTVSHWAPPGQKVFTNLIARLNAAEAVAGGDPTWGGNPTSGIAGSSQVRASALSLEQVVAIVAS